MSMIPNRQISDSSQIDDLQDVISIDPAVGPDLVLITATVSKQ